MALSQNLSQALSGAAGSVLGGGAPGLPELEPYQIEPTNWYKSLPYGFVFFNRFADSSNYQANSFTIYLPILPNNIQVTTHFATNIVTTLYGVIEEHSEVRYYDITITGTTGFAPQFIDQRSQGTPFSSTVSAGRSAFQDSSLLGDLGGFLPQVSNVVNQLANTVADIGNALNGGPQNHTGVDPEKSGYVAFHNLYRFFLKYKKDAVGIGQAGNIQRNTHPISFVNYKDRVKYDCIPQTFTLTRSAENPMLYNYHIKLRAFNLRNVDASPPEQDQLSKLGLGDATGQSIFSSLAGAAGSAAALMSSIL